MPKSHTVLKLGGKPLNLNPILPGVAKLMRFLDGEPNDELFTAEQLRERHGVNLNSLAKYSSDVAELRPYWEVLHHKRFWGNPRAIAEFRRQTGGLA